MKKIITLGISIFLFISLISCGNSQHRQSNSEPLAAPLEISSAVHRIQIRIGSTIATAELDDSDIARQFLALLPQTISMNRGRERVYWGRLTGLLTFDAQDAQRTFVNADVGYWYSGNSLALFFDDTVDNTLNTGVIMFGKITSDFSVFRSMRGQETMVVTLAH
jgi:hypothetical protein